jgi:predicted HTH transcriptional regulator
VIPDEELRRRLADHEDGWTERKPKGVSTEDITKAIVAFANSLPDGQTAVLFIGLNDKTGAVEGVDDTDALQKNVRRAAEQRAYPPIHVGHNCRVFDEGGKKVVAVMVEASGNRPHFAGPAFVRVGTESLAASAQQFDLLIASRTSAARLIIEAIQRGKEVLVEVLKNRFDKPRLRCKVIECNPHYVVFQEVPNGNKVSGPLSRITASYVWQADMTMFTIENY